MENRKFRNHILSAFESIGSLFVIFILFVFNMITDGVSEGDIDAEDVNIGFEAAAIVVAVIMLIFVIVIAWQIRIWYKTWIIIEDGAISVERNTINFKKNTIGIKNISNVNTEQNLFEMIFGISKIKINTNSLTTANATDMKIVLKKAEAEQLKQTLISEMEALNEGKTSSQVMNRMPKEYDFVASPKDIFLNSIYSINIGKICGLMIIIGTLLNAVSGFILAGTEGMLKKVTFAVGVIMLIVFIAVTIAGQLIMTYLKTSGFSTKRENNKIYIKYGIIKQVDFSIPVDKINAIVIHQTFIARIFHRYSAELINVGMGDDKEDNTYFCFYCSKNKLLHTINTLLPELSDSIGFRVERQPKQTILLYVKSIIIWLLLTAAIEFVVIRVANVPYVRIALSLGAIFLAVTILVQILTYFTRGMNITGEYLNLKDGAFGTTYTILKVDKIQYITIQRNILTDKMGIARGYFKILAMAGKNSYAMPYFKKAYADSLKNKLLKVQSR